MADQRTLEIILKLKDQLGDELRRVSGQIDGARKQVEQMGPALDMARNASIALGGAVLAFGAGALHAASQAEQAQASFEVMLGSAEKAQGFIAEMKNFSARTPFQFKDIADASQTMLAFGIESQKVMGYIQMLGDASMGNSEKFKSMALAFSQIQSTGRLMGQDLLQLVNQGFNPLTIISQKTGESMVELKKRMEDGGISAAEVAEAFKTATSEGGRFFGSMEKQSQTLAGQWSTLKDTVTELMREIGEKLIPVAKQAIAALGTLAKNINPEVAASFLAVAGAVSVAGVAVTGMIKLLPALTAAWVIATGPIGVIVAALILLTGIIKSTWAAFKIVGQQWGIFWRDMATQAQGAIDWIVSKLGWLGDVAARIFSWIGNVAGDFGGAMVDAGKDLGGYAAEFVGLDSLMNVFKDSTDSAAASVTDFTTSGVEQFAAVGGAGTKASDDMKKAAEAAADAWDKVKDSVADVTKEIEDLVKKQQGILTDNAKQELDTRQQLAAAYVDQEKKVADLKIDLEDKKKAYTDAIYANDRDKALAAWEAAKEVYEQEGAALDTMKTIELANVNEVAEARRVANLTDFQRTVESIQMKATQYRIELAGKLKDVETELKAKQDLHKQLVEFEQKLSLAAIDASSESTKAIVANVDKIIQRYQKMAEAAIRAYQVSGMTPAIQSQIPGRASGGPVSAGTPYVVGEVGPELFIPRNSGTIVPNSALGGGTVVNVYVQGDVSGQELVDKVQEGIMQSLRMNAKFAF